MIMFPESRGRHFASGQGFVGMVVVPSIDSNSGLYHAFATQSQLHSPMTLPYTSDMRHCEEMKTGSKSILLN
jgi:hypothetical protein